MYKKIREKKILHLLEFCHIPFKTHSLQEKTKKISTIKKFSTYN